MARTSELLESLPFASMVGVGVVLVATSGCLEVPSYRGDGGTNGSSDLVVTRDGTTCEPGPDIVASCTLTVRNDEFSLAFAQDGTRMPTSLTISGGANVLATGDLTNDPRGLGLVLVSGIDTVAIDALTPIMSQTLTVDTADADRVGITVHGTDNEPSLCAGQTSWTSTFTITRAGLIMRHDDLTLSSDPAGCNQIGTYAAIDASGASFDHLTYRFVESEATGVVASNGTPPGPWQHSYRICFADGDDSVPGRRFAIAYDAPAMAPMQDVRIVLTGTAALAVIGDWLDMGQPGSQLGIRTAAADVTYSVGASTTCPVLDARFAAAARSRPAAGSLVP